MRENRVQSTEHRAQTINIKSLGLGLQASGLHIEHGGNIYRVAKELGVPARDIIDFSASINPLGISERVKTAVMKALQEAHHYPDPEAERLREELAAFHGIDPEGILCGNGSTELIYLIPRALKPERVLIPAPTFAEYERAVARAQEADHRTLIRFLYLEEERDFRIDPEEFIEAMRKNACDMAFLCNPNNPTGLLMGRDEVLKIAEAASNMECILVVDEAFMDFCPGESVIKAVESNPYLIVLRSMTKFYSLTGLRVGYGVFPLHIIETLKGFKEPWTVNVLAQAAAIEALRDIEYAEKTREFINSERMFLEDCLRQLGIKPFPSEVNFYLLKLEKAETVVESLRRKGILVRDCSNFKGLDNSYVRIAVRSRKENTRLIEELSRVCRD
jgi:threonine-phosphate decarboxylase